MPANNNFGFGVYKFDVKRGTQSKWFSSSIMLKKIDLSWKKILNLNIWSRIFKPIKIYFLVQNRILKVHMTFFQVFKWKNSWNLSFKGPKF